MLKNINIMSQEIKLRIYGVEILIIIITAIVYAGSLLNPNPNILQQTGEHNESTSLAILVDQSYQQGSGYPRWNPYMMTGVPHSGDPISQFPNPIALLLVIIYDAVTGVRISIFISLIFAGIGQLIFGYVLGFKFIVRLWSALLFMLSGGLAMIWRSGTLGLLIGAAWIPYSFAFLIWSLYTKRRLAAGLTAVSISLLIMSGHTYWFLYFLGSALVIILLKIGFTFFQDHTRMELRRVFIQLLIILIFTLGLSAMVVLPLTDAWVYMEKEAPPDKEQKGSQRIIPAVFNYVLHDFDYYQSSMLGKTASGSWLYIGTLPFLLISLIPLTYRSSPKKPIILTLGFVILFLFAWHANKHNVFGKIYQKIPFLYYYRFPDRILTTATSPLIALAGFGLSYLVEKASQMKGRFAFITAKSSKEKERNYQFSLRHIMLFIIVLMVGYSTIKTLRINKSFAFDPGTLDPVAEKSLSWLRDYDPGVYYINVGNWPIIWSWMPAAYQYHHKVINFKYSRVLESWKDQNQSQIQLKAEPKYIIARSNNPPDSPHQTIFSYQGLNIYEMKDILPYAFNLPGDLYRSGERIKISDVKAQDPRLEEPHRIVVDASTTESEDILVVLESYYPGWKVKVDGKSADLLKIDHYLGVKAVKGDHQYTFIFKPVKFISGVWISTTFLILVCIYMMSDDQRALSFFQKKVDDLKLKRL